MPTLSSDQTIPNGIEVPNSADRAHPTVAWAIGLFAAGAPARSWPSDVQMTVRLDDAPGYQVRVSDRQIDVTGDASGVGQVLSDLAAELAAGGSVIAAAQRMAGQRRVSAVPVRSIARSFSSAVWDLGWFRDREFWTEYLDWMAYSRFSQFHLALGMQYNYGADGHNASDNYLCFAYPFLIDTPGWDVHAQGVDADERAQNLEALRFIAAQTKRRGMRFQLGLWNHAYDFGGQTEAWYPIRGLNAQTHARYSGESLQELLRLCPDIDGLTFRIHYEGGIPEDIRHDFWDTVFAGASAAGRPLTIDLHAKGVDESMLKAIDKPNLHPVLSAKYWAEHMGLPYHQAAIRPREAKKSEARAGDMKGITEYSRLFTRYGYADFLAEQRPTDVMFRVWPGTQRLLLWGDPAIASGYGRCATIGGSLGVDFCEPLYFAGRKGSGREGTRDPYVDPELQLDGREWRKYRYTYLLWGRMGDDPQTDPQVWRRLLHSDYGENAAAVEQCLSALSRVMPLVTVAHGVSASNNENWLELYLNLPICERSGRTHYAFDTPEPGIWGTVSPFDPQLFYTVDGFVADLLNGDQCAKYTPLEVAQWIDDLLAEARPILERLQQVRDPGPQLRRTIIDCWALEALGEFFAGKFRAAVSYSLFQRLGNPHYLHRCIEEYVIARDAYARLPEITRGVYPQELSFGVKVCEHGHWSQRLPAIDADIEELRALLAEQQTPPGSGELAQAPAAPQRSGTDGLHHAPPSSFHRGEDLLVQVRLQRADIAGAVLHYRHLDQSKEFQTAPMTPDGDALTATIPGAYTRTEFPLMYYVEFHTDDGSPVLFPGLGEAFSDQPYYVLHSSGYRAHELDRPDTPQPQEQ